MSYPDPLVPAEVDLRDFKYMELDVQMLRDSRFAAEVEPEAFRAGLLLWCASWHQLPAASLPDNDVELSTLAGFGRVVKEWRKVRDQALQLFVRCNDGRLYHPVIAQKALEAWSKRLHHHFERACDRARKANKARETEGKPKQALLTFEQWNAARLADRVPMDQVEALSGIPALPPPTSGGIPSENALRGRGNGEGEGEGEGEVKGNTRECLPAAEPASEPPAAPAMPPPPPPAPPPPAPTPAPPAPAPSAAKASPARGTRLPEGWQLPKAWGVWAQESYPHWSPDTVRLIAEKFRNHWKATSGKAGTKLDWLATWQNWCHSGITQKEHPPPKAAPPASGNGAGPDWAQERDAHRRAFYGPAAAKVSPSNVIDMETDHDATERLAD